MNNSKRKLLSTIGSLALVLVIAVGGVIGALAALSANVQSTFSISYTAHNVHAIITGDYADSTGTQVGNLVDSEDEDTQIVFNGNEGDSAKKGFQSENFKILGPNDHMDVHYIVQNTGENPFGLKMEFTGDLAESNMQVRYSVQYWNGTDPKPAYNFNQQTLAEMYLTEAGTDKCCAVVGMRFSVVDEVKDATLDATMNFDLDSNAEPPEEGPLLKSWSDAREKVFEFESKYYEESVTFYEYYWYENIDTNSITFDRFTSEGVYNVDGKNVIDGIKPIDVQDDGKILAYKVPTGDKYNVYFLSKAEMRFNDESFEDLNNYGFFSTDNRVTGYVDLVLEYGYVFIYLKNVSFKSVDTTAMTNLSAFFARVEPRFSYYGDSTYLSATIDISGFDTQNVTDMRAMFYNYGANEPLDLSSFETSNVIRMYRMFSGAQVTELNLSGWNTSKVTEINNMFYNCRSLKTIYVSDEWDLSSTTGYTTSMFYNCDALVGGKGTAYTANETSKSYACVDEGPDSEHPGYLTHIRDKKN